MKKLFRRLATVAASMLLSAGLWSQTILLDSLERRYNFYTKWCAPEKLFLHIDRTYYTSGETIWFSAYLKNASSAMLLPESNYIYVELTDKEGLAISRVKIRKGKNSEFTGNIEIPDNTDSGDYCLRAYTRWHLNTEPEYMFHQSIRILGFTPFKKTEDKASGKVDISFYPEGGRYFAGQKAVVYCKAMDRKGRSVSCNCWLVNNYGVRISPLICSYDGMGKVSFIPKEGESYYAEMNDGKKYPLPQMSAEGVSIQLRNYSGYYYITVCGKTPGNYKLFIRDLRSIDKLTSLRLDSKPRVFKLDQSAFKSGINHLLLLNQAGEIVSERLLYVYPKEELSCSLVNVRDSMKSRSLVRADVSLKDSKGNPADGRFSVSVVRGSFSNYLQNDGIVSYFNLSSELKGTLNNPGHYFDTRVPLLQRMADMDMLMAIQGWRYYDMTQVTRTDKSNFVLHYMREYYQSVSGRIDRMLSGKVPKNFLFSVFIPKTRFNAFRDVESGRYFTIDSVDFEEGTGVFVKVDRIDGGAQYVPKWDGETFAPAFKYFPAPGFAGVAAKEEVNMLSEAAMTDSLQAAVVTAYIDPFESFGGRSVSASDFSFFSDYSLVDYIKLKTPAFVYTENGMYNKRRMRGSGESTDDPEEGEGTSGKADVMSSNGVVKLIVDDMEQPWEMFESVYLADIANLSISTSPEFMYGSDGGIVLVKMKSGARIERQANTQPSLLYFVPLGYQTPRYFYSPRYDRGDLNKERDLRNTLFWEPLVKVEKGKARIEFCDSDQLDYPYYVRIEGVASDGTPFSCHTQIQQSIF